MKPSTDRNISPSNKFLYNHWFNKQRASSETAECKFIVTRSCIGLHHEDLYSTIAGLLFVFTFLLRFHGHTSTLNLLQCHALDINCFTILRERIFFFPLIFPVVMAFDKLPTIFVNASANASDYTNDRVKMVRTSKSIITSHLCNLELE